jgi:hypothetical protein
MTNWPNGSSAQQPNVSSPYGDRAGGAFSFHYGTDFTGYATVKAVADGVVTFVGWLNDKAGYAVAYDVASANGVTTTVVHMHGKNGSSKVAKGVSIKAGDSILTMGATGNATGKCDHVEVRNWRNGKYSTTNPERWISNRIAAETKPKNASRKAKVNINGRTSPNTHAHVTRTITKGTRGAFDAYMKGENVKGNDVWFRAAAGRDWFWSGGFTSKSTRGMKAI